MELLVIEDDPLIRKAVARGLQAAGHGCVVADKGDAGLALARNQFFDAIVLDMMLPGLDGAQVLRELRATGARTPVIVLTALGSIEDKVRGLSIGADDYLVKPFEFAELMARIEAVCRRSPRPTSTVTVGELTVDLVTRVVKRAGKTIDLTPTEFRVLEMLLRHEGMVVTRKMLCEHLWEADWEGTTNVIEVHINRIRGKIDAGFASPLIHTVRGRGYVLRAT